MNSVSVRFRIYWTKHVLKKHKMSCAGFDKKDFKRQCISKIVHWAYWLFNKYFYDWLSLSGELYNREKEAVSAPQGVAGLVILLEVSEVTLVQDEKLLQGDFLDFFLYEILHCFICRPSDSTVSEDAHPQSARSHPRSTRSHLQSARSYPHSARSLPHSARSHPHSARSHPQSARSHPQSARSHPHSARSQPQNRGLC